MLTRPEFRVQNCTRFRYRYSACCACADACPHDAIVPSDEGIAISETDCRNCALCAAACPTEALTADNLPRLDILKRALDTRPERLSVACAPSEAHGDEIVPCLGALDAAMVATLAANGIEVVLVGTHHCNKCLHGKTAGRMIASHLNAVGILREAVGAEGWAPVSVIEAETAGAADTGHDPSRRHLFRRFLGRPAEAVTTAARAVEPQPVPLKAVRFATSFSTISRELLQRLFYRVPASASDLPRHDALFAAKVEIAPGCTACEVCARACPTGALQIEESGAGWALTFKFARCVACGLCLEACQPRVLRYANAMNNLAAAREAVTLHALGKQRCGRCDRFFISPQPEELCPVCEGDDADFASMFG